MRGRRAYGPAAALAALLFLPLWGTAGCGGAEQVEAPAELKPFLPFLPKNLQPARVVPGRLVEPGSMTDELGLPITIYRVLSNENEWLGRVTKEGDLVFVYDHDNNLVGRFFAYDMESLQVAALVGRDGRRIGTASLSSGWAYIVGLRLSPWVEASYDAGRWWVREDGRLIGTLELDGTIRRTLR